MFSEIIYRFPISWDSPTYKTRVHNNFLRVPRQVLMIMPVFYLFSDFIQRGLLEFLSFLKTIQHIKLELWEGGGRETHLGRLFLQKICDVNFCFFHDSEERRGFQLVRVLLSSCRPVEGVSPSPCKTPASRFLATNTTSEQSWCRSKRFSWILDLIIWGNYRYPTENRHKC